MADHPLLNGSRVHTRLLKIVNLKRAALAGNYLSAHQLHMQLSAPWWRPATRAIRWRPSVTGVPGMGFANLSDAAAAALVAVDPAQRDLMDERVLVLDPNDQVIGFDTKVNTHLVGPNRSIKLHRAFSVFWFSPDGQKMLLQQRAASKVTFPGYWTNACCSHPLNTPTEFNPNNDPVLGVKNAAVRKLSHELGVPNASLKPEQFTYMTRVHYQAESDCEVWGEHEIDYVLLLRSNFEEPGFLQPNKEEVDDIRLVSPEQLRTMFEESRDGTLKLTPWFRYITEKFVFQWWPSLMGEPEATCDQLAAQKSPDQIHFVGEPCSCSAQFANSMHCKSISSFGH